jgi:hypothetical protein
MRVTFQRKTKDSMIEGCPARYRITDDPDGAYVIVGKRLTDEELSHVNEIGSAHHSPIGPDEIAVRVPRDIIDGG